MLTDKCGVDCYQCDKKINILSPLVIDDRDKVCVYIGCTTDERFEVDLPKKCWLFLSSITGNETKAESWLAARIHETITLSTNTIERYLRIKLGELLQDETK